MRFVYLRVLVWKTLLVSVDVFGFALLPVFSFASYSAKIGILQRLAPWKNCKEHFAHIIVSPV